MFESIEILYFQVNLLMTVAADTASQLPRCVTSYKMVPYLSLLLHQMVEMSREPTGTASS